MSPSHSTEVTRALIPDGILPAPGEASRTPTARVAPRRSVVTPAGGGVPSTYTTPTATPTRTAAPATPSHTPHSFAAPQPMSRLAVIPLCSLTLSTLVLAALGAITSTRLVPAAIGAAVAVGLGFCCLILIVAELVHRVERARTTQGGAR